jgi:hypothetical protein
MKVRNQVVTLLCALCACACAPYRIDHEHLVFDETAGFAILERSTEAVSSAGKPLRNGKTGFPTKVVLKREHYEIHFDLPPGSMPLLFLSVRTSAGAVLAAEGAHLRRVHPDAEVLGYQYGFDVREADGDPLELVIRGADGAELGRERLTYRIQSRGVSYGVETV